MNPDYTLYIVTLGLSVLFTVHLVSAEDTSLYKNINNEDKRFSDINDYTNEDMPYSKQYWFYPHTSQNFLRTLLRYLALNEQSYRNTVKRQRTFGFVGSRGKRGDVEGLKDFLRQLKEESFKRTYGHLFQNSFNSNGNEGILKIKRQPHLGFHGMRG